MTSRIVSLGLLAAGLFAQTDPKELIQRAKEKIVATTTRMPRYLCTQTVDRQQFEPDALSDVAACATTGDKASANRTHITESDRVRLDVAVARKAEIYSWAGENRFSDRSLWDFVTEGVFSNGTFYSFLSMIFLGDPAEFFYNGEILFDGRTLAEFSYLVPREQSHYKFGIGNKDQWWITAYEGTILVDPKTADLVRLVVRSTNLPSETGDCQVETSMRYGTVHVNSGDFLLPSETVLKTLSAAGIEKTNRTVYSNCHEFLGESKISFDDASAGAAPTKAAESGAPKPALKAGTSFSLELAQDIDTRSAAAGDAVKARLRNTAHSPGLTLPKGTIVNGRLLKVQQYYRPASALLTIRFDSFELAGAQIPFHADWHAGFMAPLARSVRPQAQSLGTFNSISQHNVAAYHFRNLKAPVVLKQGFESDWVAVSP